VSDLEVPKILRLLKTLERSVLAGEDVDPFKLPSELQSSAKRSVAKRSGKGSKRVKPSECDPREGDSSVVHSDPDDLQESTVNLESLLKCLAAAKESIMAAECCISILSSDRLPKQVRTYVVTAEANLTGFS
jgi:cohesin loading factor subunit SCC2